MFSIKEDLRLLNTLGRLTSAIDHDLRFPEAVAALSRARDASSETVFVHWLVILVDYLVYVQLVQLVWGGVIPQRVSIAECLTHRRLLCDCAELVEGGSRVVMSYWV